jgi:hypothetical protein
MGFFKAPLESARAHLVAWLREIEGPRGLSIEEQPAGGRLEEVLRSLLPPTTRAIERRVLIPTVGPWTAYLDNLELGTDPGAVSYLARRMKCTGVHFVAQPLSVERTPAGERHDGAVALSIYGRQDNPDVDNTIRAIQLFGELDEWAFRESGQPLPYEDTSAYRAPRVEDRFTIEMLERYLREMGIRAFEEDFYRPLEACLVATQKSAP